MLSLKGLTELVSAQMFSLSSNRTGLPLVTSTGTQSVDLSPVVFVVESKVAFATTRFAANLVVAKATFDSTTNTTGLKSTDWVPVLVTNGNPVRFDDKENIWADTSSVSPFKD